MPNELLIILSLGLILGSFANVVILRWPEGKSFVWPGSHCPKCSTSIRWYDNIPVISWVILRAKCRKCGARIHWRYPVIELLCPLLFATVYFKVGWNWTLVEYLWLAFGLLVVSVIDLEHFLLPDIFTLSGIVLGLAGAALNPERSFGSSVLGALMGGGFLWAIAYFYYLWRHEEGMGGGDIKLLAWIGAVLGWTAIPFVILASSLVGSFVGIALAARSKAGLKTSIPFGPYLSGGAILYILVGDELSHWYWSFFVPSLHTLN